MYKILLKSVLFIALLFLYSELADAQISPGELSKAHSELEGISNCKKCHDLGKKVSSVKCLDCHTEIKELVDSNRGYHVSEEVKTKECFECHNEHHGRDFELNRFDKDNFDHKLTSYTLLGRHGKIDCAECHKDSNIPIKKTKKSGQTYLGLQENCLSCHTDYHRQTMSVDCAACHVFESFKPAPGFDHQKTKFQLKGKHLTLDCSKCHSKELADGISYQKFAGIAHSRCTDCHTDVHKGKFGADCMKCHSENSFKEISDTKRLDHNKTDYPLEGKHLTVECKVCHKKDYTSPLEFQKCIDCHTDYHRDQFRKTDHIPDCSECHSVQGFVSSTFSIEKHNELDFRLEGAHLASPCIDCHRKGEKWEFRNIGKTCVDCHNNIHKGYNSDKYFSEKECISCHSVNSWKGVSFNHDSTSFVLEGKHKEKSCRDCHFPKSNENIEIQRFSDLTKDCLDCHNDEHQKQFSNIEPVYCTSCHGFDNWKANKFNHDNSRFKLDGEHKDLECRKCHEELSVGTSRYIQYKTNKIKCIDCHS